MLRGDTLLAARPVQVVEAVGGLWFLPLRSILLSSSRLDLH